MLTREEAKTKDCPIKMGNPKLLRSEYKCKAEDCPKWIDAGQGGLWCSNNIDYGEISTNCPQKFTSFVSIGIRDNRAIDKNINPLKCNKCPHRYGYCGGEYGTYI